MTEWENGHQEFLLEKLKILSKKGNSKHFHPEILGNSNKMVFGRSENFSLEILGNRSKIIIFGHSENFSREILENGSKMIFGPPSKSKAKSPPMSGSHNELCNEFCQS